MDDDLEPIYQEPSRRKRLSPISLAIWVVGGASFVFMMIGLHTLDNGDHRGWWMIGVSFILPEVTFFYFIRHASVFDGATPKHWALQDKPLVTILVIIAFSCVLYTTWKDSALVAAWKIPAQADLITVSGTLAADGEACWHDCGKVPQVRASDRRLLQFTCTPGMIDSECMDADTYRTWIGKPVVVRYFITDNYRGPDNVVVDLKEPSGNVTLVTADQQLPQLARDLVHYRNEASHPNIMGIWMTLMVFGAIAMSFFKRETDEPNHQY